MAQAIIEIKEQGLDKAIAAMKGGARAVADPDLKLAIARYFSSEAKNRFDTKQDPYGKAWAKTKGNDDTMVLSGALRASISEEVSSDRILVGSRGAAVAPYAAQRQWGGTIKPVSASMLAFKLGNKMIFAKSVTQPGRAYIGFAERDRAVVIDMVKEAIAGGMGGSVQ